MKNIKNPNEIRGGDAFVAAALPLIVTDTLEEVRFWQSVSKEHYAGRIFEAALALIVFEAEVAQPFLDYIERTEVPEVISLLRDACDQVHIADHLLSSSDESDSDNFGSILNCQATIWNNFEKIQECYYKRAYRKGVPFRIEQLNDFWCSKTAA